MPSIFNSFRQKNRAEVEDEELRSYGSTAQLRKNEATVNELPVSNGLRNTNTGSSWNILRRSWVSISKFWARSSSTITDGQQVSWRPMTLRAAVLLCFFIVSLSVVGILEYLSYQSSHNGNGRGLAFAASTDDLSMGASFLYLQLPTIISVCYSMLWSWVDLDAKRLEPWFQLSKPEGSSAENSILLQYPADFLGFVPLGAARRKHWAVFYAGGIMMMVIWFITPLQSAIFTTGTVARTRESLMYTTKSLPAIELQNDRFNASFLNTGYGISWLNQQLPAYGTKSYVLVPFAPLEVKDDPLPTEIWSTTTEMYSTSLSCSPAEISIQLDYTYTFNDNAGCKSTDIGLPQANEGEYVLLYIQWYSNSYDDNMVACPTCGAGNEHKFLAIWANGDSHNYTDSLDYSNITALFCEPSYEVRTVYAQVNASDQSVISNENYVTVGSPRSLTEDEFNITKFEYVIGTGVEGDYQSEGDWPDVTTLEQYPRVFDYNIVWPITNMVGFAVANMNSTMDELKDPIALQQAFETAHQLLFTSAFTTLLDSSNSTSRNGTKQDRPGAIIFVRTFSIIVEASLCVVAALTLCLWIKTFRRSSNMTKDPASIMDIMSSVSDSQQLLSKFSDDGHITEEALAKKLSHCRFRLIQVQEEGHHRMRLEALSGQDVVTSGIANQPIPQNFHPIRPKELRFFSGIVFVSYMLSGLIAIIYLFWKSNHQNGISYHSSLKRPSNNSLVLSIIENLVPTIFTTLLEPFWVLLNRFLCLLRPFDDLRVGNSKPDATLRVKYTSLPPQLVFWRAFRARHFILAAVCTIAISTNILSVALSGLFNESSVSVPVLVNSTYSRAPLINSSINIVTSADQGKGNLAYADHFYVSLSNLTANTSFPPWIDDKYFYIPYALSQLPKASTEHDHGETQVENYQAKTRGFGVEYNCTSFFDNDSFGVSNSSGLEVTINHTLSDGRLLTCSEPLGNTGNSPITGSATLEILTLFTQDNLADATGLCDQLLVAGWARLGPAVSTDSEGYQNLTAGRSLEYSFMSCLPTLLTAEFNVTVGSDGRVLSSNQSSAFDDTDQFFTADSSNSALLSQFNDLIRCVIDGDNLGVFHNDSFTPDWTNSLLKATLDNNVSFIDPSYPVPDITVLAPKSEALYQTISAIIFGLNYETGLVVVGDNNTIVSLTIMTTQTRIFLSNLMFEMSIILLALHSLIAVAFYVRRPRRFLPRMPSTIASIIAYVSASHALEDVIIDKSKGYVPRTYSYGRFLGVDGKTHVGIERHELVVPLEVKNPEVKRNLRWRKDPRNIDTWI